MNATLLLKMLSVVVIIFLSGCASLPPQVARETSVAFSAAEETLLGRLLGSRAAVHPGKSGIQLLDTGRDALQWRLALLALAEKAVDLQYYIWNSDYAGRLLAESVLQAADRGVRVRLLLDDFNVGDRDAPLLAMEHHPNVEVRIYNPNPNRKGLAKLLALIGEFDRLNQRMHNKTFVVDGSAAIVGGRNIGNEYFDLGKGLNFRDRELLAIGPVVAQVSNGFDTFWNSPRSYPVESISSERPENTQLQALRVRVKRLIRQQTPAGFTAPLEPSEGIVLLEERQADWVFAEASVVFDEARTTSDTAGEKVKALALVLGELTRGATREVLMESAYLILPDAALKTLKHMTARQISVRALTNSLAANDITANHAGYARRRRALLTSDIELYELKPDATSCHALLGSSIRCSGENVFGLHSKTMVFDRSTVFVGSFNINLRSIYLNSEIGMVVRSEELAERIAADIEENMRPENSWHVTQDAEGRLRWESTKDGEEVRYFHEPEAGLWRRFKSAFIALIPIEKYL